jgi:hypothetical protein
VASLCIGSCFAGKLMQRASDRVVALSSARPFAIGRKTCSERKPHGYLKTEAVKANAVSGVIVAAT